MCMCDEVSGNLNQRIINLQRVYRQTIDADHGPEYEESKKCILDALHDRIRTLQELLGE